jgi:hypothetical protein
MQQSESFPSKEHCIDWAKHELRNIEKAKSEIIRALAELLEKWLPIETISEVITKELAGTGFVSPGYVRLVLPEKYKYKKKQTSISKSGETILLNRDGSNADDHKNYSDKISVSTSKAIQYSNESKEAHLQSYINTVENNEVKNLKEQLNAAEMELEFFKDQLGRNKIIALKGKRCDGDVGQYYWGRISITQLKRELPKLENIGIKFVEVYMQAKFQVKPN